MIPAELEAGVTGKNVLEIGTYKGHTAACMAQSARRVVTVDPFCGNDSSNCQESQEIPREQNTLVEAHRSVMDFPNVTILIGRSPEGLEGFAVGYFEVAFVDGQHTYTQVAKDLEVCHRLLTPGSMVFCHDYDCNDTPEVKPAVDDCIATGAYKEVGRIDRLITLERL